jgi:hypothetical protein
MLKKPRLDGRRLGDYSLVNNAGEAEFDCSGARGDLARAGTPAPAAGPGDGGTKARLLGFGGYCQQRLELRGVGVPVDD